MKKIRIADCVQYVSESVRLIENNYITYSHMHVCAPLVDRLAFVVSFIFPQPRKYTISVFVSLLQSSVTVLFSDSVFDFCSCFQILVLPAHMVHHGGD